MLTRPLYTVCVLMVTRATLALFPVTHTHAIHKTSSHCIMIKFTLVTLINLALQIIANATIVLH